MAETPGIEYEPRDVNVRTILKAVVGLGGITVFGVLASLGFFVLLDRSSDRQERRVPPLAYGPGRLPPEPRLQSYPQVDIEDLRVQERQRLSGYGWAVAPGGAVRIPIEEAMRLYVERNAGASQEPVAASAVPPAPSPSASPASRSPRP